MNITDLIPKWLSKFFHDPKRIAFILLCLLIIQTYWGVQYREVQKQIRLLSEARIQLLQEEPKNFQQPRRMTEKFSKSTNVDSLQKRFDSLIVERIKFLLEYNNTFHQPRRMTEDSPKSAILDSLQMRIDSLLTEIFDIQSTLSLMQTYGDSIYDIPALAAKRYFVKKAKITVSDLKTKSRKYFFPIFLIGILELPLIATLIISWRRRKS